MKKEVMFSSATGLWATPQDLFDSLDAEFHFDLDPCADDENHKCEKYFSGRRAGPGLGGATGYFATRLMGAI